MGYTAAMVAVAVIGTAYSENRADARAEASEEAMEDRAKKQTAMRGAEAAKARRSRIRRAMMERSRIENQGAAQGGAASSAVMGGAAGATQQGAAGVSAINTQVAKQGILEQANLDVFKAQNETAGFGERLAGQVGSQATGSLVSAAGESIFND